jgi:O-antigen ligase
LTLFGFACCVVCAVILVKFDRKWVRKLTPVYSIGASIFILMRGVAATGHASAQDLGNTKSLLERLVDWAYYLDVIRHLPILDLLFGTGTFSYAGSDDIVTPRNAATLPVDNSYLLITMHMGLVGLAFFAFFYWRAWERLLERTMEGEHLRIGLCAFWASIPVLALFNDPQGVWGAVLLMGLIVDRTLPNHPAIDFRSAYRATHPSWQGSTARA